VAPFHLTPEFTEAAENAENRLELVRWASRTDNFAASANSAMSGTLLGEEAMGAGAEDLRASSLLPPDGDAPDEAS
jgi:hypothetical protein